DGGRAVIRRRRSLRVVAAVVLVAVAVAAAGYGIASGDEAGAPRRSSGGVLGPGRINVTIEVDNSAFAPTRLDVVEGTEVRFVLVNDDPINHELIVGPDDVHDRHASGTHAAHGAVPGEVSVGALEVAATTYRFDDPGEVLFACHLPGHFAYGMTGTVVVHEAA
ncbi:MAG TPA: plastocyanin/azurin family copper-binding protein, partial [Acidimicrobiia bacterium]|nr:plastocyanin/azurin family copper-binding protein [Acidimicrobiia bacterium]